jgi:16S rRNA (cytidine1402-2'-O)-methyltransferase
LAGSLFVVATPIGNLSDMTERAARTLREADCVLAEDTRRTRALLAHLGIERKPVRTLNAHATDAEIERVVDRIAGGETAAIVTDAGMPAISDPGTALVRAAAERGIAIVPIAGASAVTTAIAASGLVTSGFWFAGFLPRKGPARSSAIARIATTEDAVVIFESPQRVAATLGDLASVAPDRTCVVAREMTKIHEEFVRGTLAQIAATQREWVGEITVVLGPDAAARAREGVTDEDLDARIDEEIGRGTPSKSIAERLSAWSGRPRRDVYERVVRRRQHLARSGDQ